MAYGTNDYPRDAAVVDVTTTNTGANGELTAKSPVVVLGVAGGGLAPTGSSTDPGYVVIAPSATGATTSISGSASAGTILAANTARKGATIVNDSTAILYILLGAGTVTSSLYTVAMGAKGDVGSYFEVPYGFTGIITGIWASATGAARITELT